jgi:p-aminobenzoyl-glutamate transporter AbgT
MMIVVVLVIKTIIQNSQSYRSKDKKKRILSQVTNEEKKASTKAVSLLVHCVVEKREESR